MNKAGWLRIVEASIAILIILSALFAFNKRQEAASEPDLSERARAVLEEIAHNSSLIEEVLRNELLEINPAVAQRVKEPYLSFEVRICNLNDACGKSTYTPGNVYAAERVISASVENPEFAPKKVRLFIWRR